jgi:hypothetical protein
MAEMDNYNITKVGDKWRLTKEGNQRASITAHTKQKIISDMRGYMSNKSGSVKIYKQNGVIQAERTY